MPYALHRLAFILQRQSDELLQSTLGLGYSQFKLMIGLEKHPDCEQRVLAHFLGQTEASVSRQMKVMLDMGLIEIVRDKKDNRRHHVLLTDKGKTMLHSGFKHLNSAHQQALKQMDDGEVEAFLAFTNRMLHAVGAHDH